MRGRGVESVFTHYFYAFRVYPCCYERSECDCGNVLYVENALLLAFGRLPWTLLLWIVWGLPVAIVIFYPIWMVAFGWFFITIGVAVLLWMPWLVQRGAVA